MATHRATRAPRRRIRAKVVGVVLLVLGATLAAQPSANALTLTPKGKIVQPRNADVIASCKFEVNKVNEGDGTLTATLTANARPADLDGYRANRYTQVNCFVYGANSLDLFMTHSPSANGPTVFPSSTTATIPYESEYFLCGYAVVKLKNGDDSFTPTVCA
jgi:hypothetical protein